MSKINPFEIYNKFEKKNIDKSSALYYLKSIFETTGDIPLRIDIIEIVGIIKPENEDFFYFLENIIISDKNYQVRGLAAKVLIENYPKRAFEPIRFVLEKENNILCFDLINKALTKSSNSKLKSLLSINQSQY